MVGTGDLASETLSSKGNQSSLLGRDKQGNCLSHPRLHPQPFFPILLSHRMAKVIPGLKPFLWSVCPLVHFCFCTGPNRRPCVLTMGLGAPGQTQAGSHPSGSLYLEAGLCGMWTCFLLVSSPTRVLFRALASRVTPCPVPSTLPGWRSGGPAPDHGVMGDRELSAAIALQSPLCQWGEHDLVAPHKSQIN